MRLALELALRDPHMRPNTLRSRHPTDAARSEIESGEPERRPAQSVERFEPKPAQSEYRPLPLRLYTEEQVSEMLQVSLSQLRKWRMKKNGNSKGPPFKKIGRLVRYPAQGLLEYINTR